MPSATARAAVTLAVAGAVSATGLTEISQAAPPSPDQIGARVDALYQQAEAATQRYDGAQVTADSLRNQLASIQNELARRTARADEARDRLGSVAADRYRTGGEDPALQLILSSDPAQYLERASMLERVSTGQATALHELAEQEAGERLLRDQAARRLAALDTSERQIADERRTVEGKLSAARRLLGQLTSRQRAAFEAGDQAGSPGRDAARRNGSAGSSGPLGLPDLSLGALRDDSDAPDSRAAQAVAFAYAQIGKPYSWGATGPGSYDCSGLTQAAWRVAGVSLPRTTYAQINAGRRIPEDQLQPGDLVFYYPGVTHVGIYVGHGEIIHAPHPGASVRLDRVDAMPFVGATRPA